MSTQQISLQVSRRVNASRDRVFRAWTDAAVVRKWFAPPGMTVPEAEVDARVGGRFRIQMRAPDGATHTAVGMYRELSPPDRLVFTWRWEGDMGAPEEETVVTVELHERDGATEVVLTHDGFATEASREQHTKGWEGCLESLAAQY